MIKKKLYADFKDMNNIYFNNKEYTFHDILFADK